MKHRTHRIVDKIEKKNNKRVRHMNMNDNNFNIVLKLTHTNHIQCVSPDVISIFVFFFGLANTLISSYFSSVG